MKSSRVNISINATQLIANHDKRATRACAIVHIVPCTMYPYVLLMKRGVEREREGKRREMYTRRYINTLVIYSKQSLRYLINTCIFAGTRYLGTDLSRSLFYSFKFWTILSLFSTFIAGVILSYLFIKILNLRFLINEFLYY